MRQEGLVGRKYKFFSLTGGTSPVEPPSRASSPLDPAVQLAMAKRLALEMEEGRVRHPPSTPSVTESTPGGSPRGSLGGSPGGSLGGS